MHQVRQGRDVPGHRAPTPSDHPNSYVKSYRICSTEQYRAVQSSSPNCFLLELYCRPSNLGCCVLTAGIAEGEMFELNNKTNTKPGLALQAATRSILKMIIILLISPA